MNITTKFLSSLNTCCLISNLSPSDIIVTANLHLKSSFKWLLMWSQSGFNNHHHMFSLSEHWNGYKVKKTWGIVPAPRRAWPLSTKVAFNKPGPVEDYLASDFGMWALHQKSLELSMLLLYFLKLSLTPVRALVPNGPLSLVHGK